MNIKRYNKLQDLGKAAAETGLTVIREALDKRGEANIILATGTSQYQTLDALVKHNDIAWEKVQVFHLDEYIGLSDNHPASFRAYLKNRFVNKVDNIGAFHPIIGDAPSAEEECRRLSELIRKHPVDVAFIGIGENAHIAFNDPPADFETEQEFLVVELDEDCRMQQVNEGWYSGLEEVPTHAISMSIRQILKSRRVIVSIPDSRKAQAVKNMVEQPVKPDVPATILKTHPDCWVYLDSESGAYISDGIYTA